MPRLNKTQTYAIQWLHSQNQTTEQIADELGLSEDQVKKTIEKHSASKQNDDAIKTAKSPASKSHNLMITETANKRNKNVAIMTKEASQLNDELKNKTMKHPVTEKAIFRPRQ